MNVENRTKIANFHTPRVFNAPADGVPLGILYRRRGSQKTRMMGLSDGRKSFPIGLAVSIQYRSVTDTQPASQPPSHVAVAITLNALAKASSLKMDSGYKFSKSHELMLPLLLMSSPTVESYLFTPLQIFGRLFKECLLIINLFTALLFILDLNIHYLCFHNFFTELLFWLNIPL